ncbi:hypothetical protein HPB52_015436 [Rhipicephalus sanguineus]|uniref:Uncharacterized protein n=1 Tax=Rhipicephalus sanguineus TaxID=34632 RepID=A0A9D4PE68_RHISA|nr:hypothetical protein HPB52_015436 [Rhipicephalus sanguineus]
MLHKKAVPLGPPAAFRGRNGGAFPPLFAGADAANQQALLQQRALNNTLSLQELFRRLFPSPQPPARLTEEQAFLRIYQLLVAYTTFAQHMANTSHGVASCSGHAIAANSKRSAAGAATALQVATNSQRNADQLQELRCDVRLSSAAHGSQAQFAAADASAVGLILDTYVDCSKRLLAHYSVAVGVQQLLHSMRGYLLHLVRLKSPYPGADNAEAPEVFEQASY